MPLSASATVQRMRHVLAVGLILAVPASAAPQDDLVPISYPTLPTSVREASDFVPSGWRAVAIKTGDLNDDKQADVLVLMRMTNPANIKPVDTKVFSYKEDDTNPYLLAIGFAKSNGFTLAATNRDLFPRETAPMHEDDPPSADAIKVSHGVLTLSFGHLRSQDQFRFRWNGKAFALIGYEFSGSDGQCLTESSFNYLTRRAKLSIGPNSEDWNWAVVRPIKRVRLPTLGEASADTFDPYKAIVVTWPECPR